MIQRAYQIKDKDCVYDLAGSMAEIVSDNLKKTGTQRKWCEWKRLFPGTQRVNSFKRFGLQIIYE